MCRRYGAILLIMTSLFWVSKGYGGSETKLTGYTSLSYTETFPGNSSENTWTQSLNLRWIDQLYRNKITMGLDLLLTKPSDEDVQVRPTWSVDVRGYQYNLTAKFSEIRDPDYKGGQSTLITKYNNLNLTLNPPDLPRITLTYSGNRYLDDEAIHSVNSKTERITVKGDYQIGDLSVTGSHSEYTFWSKPERQDIQNFSGLVAIAIDPSGNIYTISNVTYKIQVYTNSGGFIREWGDFGSGPGQFMSPAGIAVDNSGYVYVSDAELHKIQRFTNTGDYVTQWGGFGSGNGLFNSPNGIAVDNNGYIYVADQGNQRIQKFTSAGSFITSWGATGTGDGDFNNPTGIAIDQTGNVYVTDAGNHRIQKFTNNGDFQTQWGSFGSNDGELNTPSGIVTDNQGHVYVMDYGNQRIQRFTNAGIFINKWNAHGSSSGNSIAIGLSVHLFIADLQNGLVESYTSEGSYLDSFGDFLTLTTNESRYKTITDQLALSYGIHPSDYFDFNLGYNVTNTHREGTSIATTNTLYQEYSFGWRITPVEYASIYGNHYFVFSASDVNDRQTQNSNNVTHDFGLALRPYDNTNITLGYSRSEFTEDTTSNTRSDSESINITSKLYQDLNLNGNYSHSETFSMDTKTSISDQLSMTLTAQLLPEAAADLIFSHNETKNIQDDSNSQGNSLGLRWRSQPTEKVLWNESIQWSENQSKTVSNGTTETSDNSQISYSTELNYWPRSYLNLFMNGTYTQNFQQTDNLTYTTGFTWRPKNNFYTTNSFSQTLSDTDSLTFSTNFEFQFRYQLRLSLGYRYFDQENSNSTQTIYARLTKTF